MNEKIKLSDSTMDVVLKMSEGNPGAMNVIMQLMMEPNTIDPDNGLGGMGVVLRLDSIGIYGTGIYVLHNDLCGRNMAKMQAVIRATGLGFFSSEVLKDACHRQDYSGRELVPVEELYLKVKERLPNFDNN